MRFLHIADLHFGKSIYNISILEDQRVWTERFIEKVHELNPDAIVISGDVYDRSQPSDDAVELFDSFIAGLAKTDIPVLITAGNHDSASKLSLHSVLLRNSRIYLSGGIKKKMEKITLNDEYGEVDFFLMPSIFPAAARKVLDKTDIHDYTDAVTAFLAAQEIDYSRRTVLVAHQCVTANGEEPERGMSESFVGGLTGIEYTAFDGFDYVALGHIHRDMSVGREGVRYCGTPMCYHFNETKQGVKGALMVELDGRGNVTTEKIAIDVIHHMREVRGTFNEVLAELASAEPDTWFRVILTDRRDDAEAVSIMRDRLAGFDDSRGCRLLEHESEKRGYENAGMGVSAAEARKKNLAQLFEEFYISQQENGEAPSEQDAQLFKRIEHTAETMYGDSKEPSNEAIEDIINFMLKQEAAK